MLDGFGLAPVSLQIDLDSYDGPWTHVHRFRGQSGWLVVADAHLTSEAARWDTTIVAACNAWDEPVPTFMAPNLLACACSLPQPCFEFPPDVLDDLLIEEEGALISRFLRAGSHELAQLHERTRDRVEAMEASTRSYLRAGERQIAELRRRRRMAGAGDADRETIDAIVRSIEAENDFALERLSSRRAGLRAEANALEERLMLTADVEVAVTTLYHVHWHACVDRREEFAECQEITKTLRAGSLADRSPPPRWRLADIVDPEELRREHGVLSLRLKKAKARQAKLDAIAASARASFPNWAPRVCEAELKRKDGQAEVERMEAATAGLEKRIWAAV